jgi:hypothetical protein
MTYATSSTLACIVNLAVQGNGIPHALSSEIRQSINILNLAWVAHVAPVSALRKLMTQVGHGDVRTVTL